jgi:hypothetical protein
VPLLCRLPAAYHNNKHDDGFIPGTSNTRKIKKYAVDGRSSIVEYTITFSMPHGTGATMSASTKHGQPYPRALTYTLLLFASHFFTQSKWTRSSLQVITSEAARSQ